jgi:acetylornithine deacetylase/succinyl-diaminopimelate desuccinylase-like protein
MMKPLALWLTLALSVASAAAAPDPRSIRVRTWRQTNERTILHDFSVLLAIPNVSSDRAGIQENATALVALLTKRGVSARLVSAPDANPIVFGEIRTKGAKRTIGLYAHYDGQPVDAREWATPPFEPTLRDGPLSSGGKVLSPSDSDRAIQPEFRLYARGASDDKGAVQAMLSALDAIRALGLKLRSNVKFAFEGEEEAYSPHLEQMLASNRELFQADVWLICDGPVAQDRRQAVLFGARGFVAVDITVYGPNHELHSGHYGNWAPNPAMLLAKLLSSMKDDTGHVLISGFYDGIEPLGALEREAIREAPDLDAQLMQELAIGSTEGAPQKLTELITRPSLNIRGLASARVGPKASSVIPAQATADIDIRLVKGMDYRRTVDQLKEHVRKQGYYVVDAEPSADVRRAHALVAQVGVRPGGYNAVRTPMDLPISREVIQVVERVRGQTVKYPNMGASLPLDGFDRALGAKTILIPIANHDNNQHSFDENIRLQNLWDGIELMAALILM